MLKMCGGEGTSTQLDFEICLKGGKRTCTNMNHMIMKIARKNKNKISQVNHGLKLI